MTATEFCKRHPCLFHMAHPGALESIQRHGLLSTQALAELVKLPEEEQTKLCASRRPDTRELQHAGYGSIFIRDQRPISEVCLVRCLQDGLTPADWYRTLNARVFLWADRSRLLNLRNSQSYRREPHLILTIDSKAFLDVYYDRITVSTFNTGYAKRKAKERGLGTFVPLREVSRDSGPDKIVEVTVAGGIPDLKEYLVSAEITD